MKTLVVACLSSICLGAYAVDVKVVHYNIKELDSVKLKRGLDYPQIAAAARVLQGLAPDFLSINEIQYDMPGVPSSDYTSAGRNMNRFMELLNLPWTKTSVGFSPANTGTLALKIPGTTNYTTNTLERQLADPVNFGVFPGEYSSAGASKFPVIRQVFEKNVLWRDFRPGRDLSNFKDASGKPLNPERVQLFDKNFSDLTLQIGARQVHFILLHTVPAHDFGNEGSPNSARNADQLAFLEWYLTGSTEFVPPSNLKIKPLAPGSLFVAMGDWNVDVRNTQLEGGAVLRRFFSKTKLWIDLTDLKFTYESQPFYVPAFKEQLDYIITSRSDKIKIKRGGVYAPESRLERGCQLNSIPQPLDARSVVVPYRDTKTKKTCYAEVSADYAEIKTASDHRPIWAELEIQ